MEVLTKELVEMQVLRPPAYSPNLKRRTNMTNDGAQ
jgi:hypothetical protein